MSKSKRSNWWSGLSRAMKLQVRQAKHALLGMAVAAVCLAMASLASAADKPNILLIMGDDAGAEAFEQYFSNPTNVADGERIDTPNLNELANNGTRFDAALSTPLCTPTRVQIMTGRYNFRNFQTFGYLNHDETTFAEILRDNGYATAIGGKWQLSDPATNVNVTGPIRENVTPTVMREDYGFDRFKAVQITGKDQREPYWNPTLETASADGTQVVVEPADDDDFGPDRVTGFLETFIADSVAANQPFLGYYAAFLPHYPNVPTPDSGVTDPASVASDEQYFDDQVEYLDKMVGRLVDRLDDPNGDGDSSDSVRDNTLIIFTTDNGTDGPVGSGADLTIENDELGQVSGEKGQNSHFGTRVPFIMSWGDRLSGVSNRPTDFTDVLPTMLAAAGIDTPAGLKIDGKPIVDADGNLLNNRDASYNYYDPVGRDQFAPWAGEFAATDKYRLYDDGRFYNIQNDPAEDNNLAGTTFNAEQQQAFDLLQSTLTFYAIEQLGARELDAELAFLDTPPAGVSSGDLEGADQTETVFAFAEGDHTLTQDLAVDVKDPGIFDEINPPIGGSISSGTQITSFLVHFDPVGEPDRNGERVQTGLVKLVADQPILGLIISDEAMDNTDGMLGADVTTYPTGTDFRGIELSGGQDLIVFSEDRKELFFNLDAVEAGIDHFRVIMPQGGSVQLVPEPAAAVPFALGALALLRRRRS